MMSSTSRNRLTAFTNRSSVKTTRASVAEKEKLKDRMKQADNPIPSVENIPKRKRFTEHNKSSYNIMFPD